VTDASNAGGDIFGEERVLQLFQEARDAGASAALDRIEGALAAHVGDAPSFDDVTLLAVRRG
jgi:phosphoserine phosphatase RsbU/P